MNIIEAVSLAKEGKKVRRKEWFYISATVCNYVYGIKGSYDEKYIIYQHVDGAKEDESARFHANDILANDWEVLND